MDSRSASPPTSIWPISPGSPNAPPLSFDLDRNPDELENRAAPPAHAERVQAFAAAMRVRWGPQELHQAIVASQRDRRVAAGALAQGRRVFLGIDPGAGLGGYVSGDVDLGMLERSRRYPPARVAR